MLISHECPIDLLQESLQFNDYDYMLDYCFDNPKYKQFFIDSLKSGRNVMFDNSAYEFGSNLPDISVFISHIQEINPTWYIIPDYINNFVKTQKSIESWMNKYFDTTPGIAMAVCQGETYEELRQSYINISEMGIKKIGIPFGSHAYDIMVPSIDVLLSRTVGRQVFVQKMLDDGSWNDNCQHHLLGCNYAIEFQYELYQEHIESVDTSNPVLAGIENIPYTSVGMIQGKPTTRMCDILDRQTSDDELQRIKNNTKTFRSICNGNL